MTRTTPGRRAPRRAEAERNDRALLQAAREVLAVDGAHASVAAIAERAGVGIGSLYRRYRTKDDLFRHLLSVTLDQYLEAAETGLATEDPWEGLAHYVRSAIAFGPGLAPIAGTLTLTTEINTKSERADRAVAALVDRAHATGVLRPDATAMDIELLIEQLGKSPLLDQLARQGRADLLPAARDARDRLVAIALDGLRPAEARTALPGTPPGHELFTARWEH